MKTKMLILIMTVLALGACAKKSNNGKTRAIRNGGVAHAGAGTTSCAQNTWGIIYDTSTTGYDFTQRLIRFTNNPDIGYVESQPNNGQTGVDMQMTVRFDNAGQFDTGGSRFLMRIIDDRSYSQGLLQDISMGAVSGSRGNGSFQATFKDGVGTVTLQGNRSYQNNGYVEGTIYYSNNGGQSETLGRFWISTCAIVGI